MKMLLHFGIGILSLIPLQTLGQTEILNREVYQFEPGDHIHIALECRNCEDPSHNIRYLKRHFISKQTSTNQDTLFYEVQDSLYTLTSEPGWHLIVQNQSLVYHSLDSVVKPWGQHNQGMYLNYMGFDTLQPRYEYNEHNQVPIPYTNQMYSLSHFYNNFSIQYYQNFGSYFKISLYGIDIISKLLYVKRNEVLMGEAIPNLLEHRQLLNRHIYDFEPGDIFHFRATPPSIETLRTILTKRYSPNEDTLYYEVLDTVVTHNSTGSTMEIITRTLSYTNLDALPYHSNSFLNFNFSEHNNRVRNSYEFFGNRQYRIDHYYEGLGRFYWFHSSTGFWSSSSTLELKYYKKGNQAWGTPLSSQEIELAIEPPISLYPNPANQQINLKRERIHSNALVEVYSAKGVRVHGFEWHQGLGSLTLDCSMWDTGLYYLIYKTHNAPAVVQRCIISR